MSIETVKFSSYEDDCKSIQDAVQREFGEMPVGEVQLYITGKDRANVVIPIDDTKANILPMSLVVPIRLNTEIRLAQIVQQAREFYDVIIVPFANLSFDLPNTQNPQWKPSSRL